MTQNDASQANPQASRSLRRVARPQVPIQDAVILADVSSSMEDRDDPGGAMRELLSPRRIDRLARVLDYLLKRVRVRSLICFNDIPIEVPLIGSVMLPEPSGGTALHLALEHVGSVRPRPAKLLLITDGMPNNSEAALVAARALKPMVIDAYYVGPDGLDYALEFLRELAAAGGAGGRSGQFDMIDPVLLGQELHRRLLAGPGA